MEEPPQLEHWKRISVLGSGAFGVVTLWQHQITDDYVAIKKCKFKTPDQLSDRQRQRWENEVTIMKSLNCINIISFKPLPKPFETLMQKYNPTKLPLLSMEYCTKGNLRHVLNQAKNSTGLEETDVRNILHDITSAVAYLHNLNITHRDIKPENIVLQQCDVRPGGVIYKLIDLGYAKELNDSIVSFVGTLHYLAPEIIRTENYNYSVDYWSLGIVAFEIICGVLPFLPQYTPFERFTYIENKKHEHICIYQLHSGSVAYSSEILKENHISNCLKQNIETWLRHVLEYQPSLRMKKFPNDIDVFNYMLNNILQKKIINVFSVHTLEFYSYEINDSTVIGTLKDWISRDTKVPKNDQIILSVNQFDIHDDRFVIDFDTKDLYVFKKGAFINRDTFTLPKYVRMLFENCSTTYSWKDLRILYSKCLFFLSQENKMIIALLKAFQLYRKYTHYLNMKLKTNMQLIHKDLGNVLVRIDCYHNLHSMRLDTDRVEEYKKCLLIFKQLITDLEKCIHTANRLIKKVETLRRRQVVLDKVLPKVKPVIDGCCIEAEVAKAVELLSRGQGQQECKEMVKIVSNALKEKDKLLNNKNFQSYAKATATAIKDVEVLLKWMVEEFHVYIKQLSNAIDGNQREQYRILLASVKPRSDLNNFDLVNLDTDTVISVNQELRCQFEEALGHMFVDNRKFYEDILRHDLKL